MRTTPRLGPKKDEKRAPRSTSEKLVEAYMTLSYRYLGRHLDFRFDLKSMETRLKRGEVNITPGMYLSTILITSVMITLLSLPVFVMVFWGIMDMEGWQLSVFVLTISVFAASLLTYPFILSSRISKKKAEIDRELPFTLSELSVLASTGLSPVQIMRKISKRNTNRFMANEFKKIVYKLDIEGKDIITALSETAKETPSKYLRETLWDLSNMIHEGGDLDAYLRSKADKGLELKRAVQKEFIEKIATMMELYVSLVLMSVLFITMGAFTMEAMGSNFGSMTASDILMILTYGFIPISIVVFSIVISVSYSAAE